MTKTKKIGVAGRFGPRYGRRVRVMIKDIEGKSRQIYECPSCKRKALKRIAAGIWQCKKCGSRFAGGAYLPKTEIQKAEAVGVT